LQNFAAFFRGISGAFIGIFVAFFRGISGAFIGIFVAFFRGISGAFWYFFLVTFWPFFQSLLWDLFGLLLAFSIPVAACSWSLFIVNPSSRGMFMVPVYRKSIQSRHVHGPCLSSVTSSGHL